jgi:hypothetical protein
MRNQDADGAPPCRLDTRQIVLTSAFGVGFWFFFAVLIAILTPFGVFGGVASLVMFALAIPGTWPVLLVIRRVARLGAAQLVPGIALATGVATLCDGVALTWAPWLYGGVTPALAPAAAWILWGGGVGLVMAFVIARREGA